MLMAGKAKEYFKVWEADRHTTDPAKSYEERSNKVKDYARRRKLDSSARKRCSTGVTPWMLEQWAAGVGMEMGLETVLKHTRECAQWDPKAKEKEKSKENEIVTIADRRGVFPESVPISRKAKTRANDSKESVAIAAREREAIPQE